MRLWLKGALAAVAATAVGGGAAYAFWARPELEQMEAAFQTAADAKRVNDVHKIAELLEAHRAKTGRLPFEAKMPANAVVTVLIAAPKAQGELAGKGNPLGGEPPSAFAADLLAELRPVLGEAVVLPVDPQRGATGAPNAYYVRFKSGGQYLVAGFLRRPRADTATLAPGVYAYGLRSQAGAWAGAIWPAARKVADVPADERRAIRESGERADSEFGRYMQTWTDGGGS